MKSPIVTITPHSPLGASIRVEENGKKTADIPFNTFEALRQLVSHARLGRQIFVDLGNGETRTLCHHSKLLQEIAEKHGI